MSQQDDQLLRSTLNPRYLELTLLPTEQWMSPKVRSALKQFMTNRIEGIKYLNFQWFGGEPLAAKHIVYEISSFAKKLCLDHGVGFGGALTTNGYLLDMEVVEKLFGLDQKGYQISLDGMGPAHNSTRRLASGDGTFDRIWTNLKALRNCPLDVSVLLRVHLMPENVQSVKELAAMLRGELLHDKRFSVLLKPIENLGGPNSASISSLKTAERTVLLNEVHSLLNDGRPAVPSSNEAIKVVCYASRPNSFVIRADGRVQKCTVALSDEHNTVGKLMEDGSIRLNRELMGQWMRGYETGDPGDLRCPAEHFPRPAKHDKVIPIVLIS
nr:radical SAM protein [Cupriavidus basilensis]